MKLNKFFFHLIQNQKPPEINSDGFLLCHIFLQGAVHNNIAYHISVCPVWFCLCGFVCGVSTIYNSLFASTISGYRTLYTMISSIGRYKNPL